MNVKTHHVRIITILIFMKERQNVCHYISPAPLNVIFEIFLLKTLVWTCMTIFGICAIPVISEKSLIHFSNFSHFPAPHPYWKNYKFKILLFPNISVNLCDTRWTELFIYFLQFPSHASQSVLPVYYIF